LSRCRHAELKEVERISGECFVSILMMLELQLLLEEDADEGFYLNRG
jgi:hypothetical protein